MMSDSATNENLREGRGERGDFGKDQGVGMKKGWQTKQLGELAELKGRIGWRGLTAKEYTKEGPMFLSVHSLNYGDYVDFRDAFHISEERYVESPEIMLQPNDVLICKDGAGIGKLGILGELPDRATINSSLLLIRSGKHILPKYLYRCLSSPYFQDIVQSRLNGATTPHLYQRDITEFPVVLPPLAEQQRIVGLLDEAFEGLVTAKANAEKNLQNARALFESHLQSVFTQRGPGWVEKPLGDFCSFENGDRGTNYPSKSARTATGIPFINAGHLTDDGIDLETMDYIPRERFDLLSNGKIRKGDILFCLRGSLGKFASVGDLSEGAIASSLVIVRPDKTVLNDFLVAYFRSPLCTAMINRFKNGAAQPNLSAQSLRNFIAPVPPLAKQESVVEQITDLREETQRLARLYERKHAALEALKKSLLHQAFTGKLQRLLD